MVVETPTPTADHIKKLAFAFREAKLVLSAVELELFTVLAEGPLALEELRERIAINARGARDFFDALVAVGLLQRSQNDLYANTPDSDLYLDRRKDTYIGAELDHANTQLYGRWTSLTSGLRTGQPQTGAGATGNYPAFYSNS